MSWLGRGLDDVPGRPFGWAWYHERDEIRVHIMRKLDRKDSGCAFWQAHRGRGVEHRITQIQQRIHKYRPTLRERQLALGVVRPNPTPTFTPEELAHIAEHFTGANDPVGQSIYAKAASYKP